MLNTVSSNFEVSLVVLMPLDACFFQNLYSWDWIPPRLIIWRLRLFLSFQSERKGTVTKNGISTRKILIQYSASLCPGSCCTVNYSGLGLGIWDSWTSDPVHISISEPNPSPLHRSSSTSLALVPSHSDVVMVLVGREESRRGPGACRVLQTQN